MQLWQKKTKKFTFSTLHCLHDKDSLPLAEINFHHTPFCPGICHNFTHLLFLLIRVFSLRSLHDHELLSIYLSNYLAKELTVCLSICLFFESHYKWDFLDKSCLIPQPQADLVASSSLFPVLILIPEMLLFLLPLLFYLILTLISVVYAEDIEYQTHINTYHHNNIIKQKLLFIYDMWYVAHLLVEEWRWLDHALTNCIVCTEQINPD